MRARSVLSFIGFVVVAALANTATAHYGLVPIGFGLMVTAGTFFAGAALILRDAIHETAGPKAAYLAVLLGAVVSAFTAGPVIAVASGVAFLASETADAVTYTAARKRSRALAVLLSGLVGLAVDTVIFLTLAGFGLTWGAFVGQAIVKGTMTLAAAAYVARRK